MRTLHGLGSPRTLALFSSLALAACGNGSSGSGSGPGGAGSGGASGTGVATSASAGGGTSSAQGATTGAGTGAGGSTGTQGTSGVGGAVEGTGTGAAGPTGATTGSGATAGATSGAGGGGAVTSSGAGGAPSGAAASSGSGVTTGAGGSSVPPGEPIWDRTFVATDVDSDALAGIDVNADAAGNVLVAGVFGDAVDFGGGVLQASGEEGDNGDLFVLKLDPAGNHLWSKMFPGSTSQPVGTAVGPAGELALARAPSTLWRIDANGAVTSETVEAGRFLADVAIGSDGTIYAVGRSLVADPAQGDAWLAAYSPGGVRLWESTYGMAGSYEAFTHLAMDGAGNLTVALQRDAAGALSIERRSAAGTVLWTRALESATVYDLAVNAAGEVGVLAQSADGDFGAGPHAGPYSRYVVKLGAGGQLAWVRGIGCDGAFKVQSSHAVAVSGAGRVYATLSCEMDDPVRVEGAPDVGSDGQFILLYDPDGDVRWWKRTGGYAPFGFIAVSVDAGGHPDIAGYGPGPHPRVMELVP